MTGPDLESALADRPRVRPARPADSGAVRTLQAELPRPSPDLLDAALEGLGRVLVSTVDGCADGGIPVGYLLAVGHEVTPAPAVADPPAGPAGVGAESTAEEPADGASNGGDTGGAYVAEVVVAPGHRREGRARELLATVVAAVDGPVTLTVAPDNEAAVACYRAAGFERLRREPAFFDGEPALVFGRR